MDETPNSSSVPEFMKQKATVKKTKEEELAWFYKLSIEQQATEIYNHLECFHIHTDHLKYN